MWYEKSLFIIEDLNAYYQQSSVHHQIKYMIVTHMVGMATIDPLVMVANVFHSTDRYFRHVYIT